MDNKKGLGFPKIYGVFRTGLHIFSEKNMSALAESLLLFCQVKEVFLTQKLSFDQRPVLLYL